VEKVILSEARTRAESKDLARKLTNDHFLKRLGSRLAPSHPPHKVYCEAKARGDYFAISGSSTTRLDPSTAQFDKLTGAV